MLIWSGCGWVVAFCVVASVFSVDSVFTAYGFVKGMPEAEYQPAFSLMMSGVLVYLVESFLSKSRRSRRLRDLDSGEEIVWKRNDSFFFIPVKYWAGLFPCIAVVYAAHKILRLF